ncbi:MAG: HNH endonuclease, partial [Candidatus Harrisonbacteria bacterium]|nr:HNH endonuclease [Candidatus Harrisonbacteria bacterium]
WYAGKDVKFDYSKLRPAGARLKTMGGRSSGPEPLRQLLEFTRKKVLAKQGRRLGTLDVHDICCKIGEIVVSGGVRRSALISLSDLDDVEMRDAKKGPFYLTEGQRSLANNSAVYNEKPSAAQFLDEWVALAKSGTGERGIFNRGGLRAMLPERRIKALKGYIGNLGTNPCVTGDTLVYVADGRGNVPIKQLAEEGRDVPVFCLDKKGAVVIRTMRNPRVTGQRMPVYNIILDDGSSVRATANHKFRLKDGSYKEVGQLAYGDSLHLLTRFEASIKDIFPSANSRSQDYWWVNNGKGNNVAEHRLIAGFHFNTAIPHGWVVHHQDRDAQNNDPSNLEVMTKAAHDALHGTFMRGDMNPMRRARHEWSIEKWNAYIKKHSEHNNSKRNNNFSGITNEELRIHALRLTEKLGRRFSAQDWVTHAKAQGIPQSLSKWRRDHFGGMSGLAKWAALKMGIEHIDADPRVVKSYTRYTQEGYNCEIVDGVLVMIKSCEVCGGEFRTNITTREHGVCGLSCSMKRKWKNNEFRIDLMRYIRDAHNHHRALTREEQAKIYSDFKFAFQREPLKNEWKAACKGARVSFEISRSSSPFRSYAQLKEYASSYNHKVVSVKFAGYETVYNGTVDEFHNFFVGGFIGATRHGKQKQWYLNNSQCGEIILQSRQFCNLSEIVARPEDTLESLTRKCRVATILGTYQSTLTNFGYLSKEWKENCEAERLLGVSITGQWDSSEVRKPEVLKKLKEVALRVNKEYAKRLGVNESTCITCVKPSGNLSQTVDASSGMHTRYAKYYIRRVRISATDSLFKMLRDQKLPYHPEVGQSAETANTFVLEFPVQAPEGAATRHDLTALEQLEHWKLVKTNYTEHNPSVTIYVGEDEWIAVANWLYNNWAYIGGLSFLPKDTHVYPLAPYEEITEARYKELAAKFPDIDFSQIFVYERQDETEAAKELACVAGVCEIT